MPSVVHDRRLRHAVLAALLIGVPFMLGNGGSAVIGLVALHLLFANAAFGMIEWLVVRRWSTRPWYIGLPLAVGANYVSAFAGFIALLALGNEVASAVGPLTIETARPRAWLLLVLGMLVGLLVEAAAYWFVIGRGAFRVRRTLKATLWCNAVTYPLVIGAYAMNVEDGFYSRLEHTTPARVVESHPLQPRAWVFYLRADSNAVVRSRLDGSEAAVVYEGELPRDAALIGVPVDAGRVEVRLGGLDRGNYDLKAGAALAAFKTVAVLDGATRNVLEWRPGGSDQNYQDLAAPRVIDPEVSHVCSLGESDGTEVRLCRAARLISVYDRPSARERVERFGFDWPVGFANMLEAGRGTLIPGGLVVFEVGRLLDLEWRTSFRDRRWNQICLLDIPNRRLGVLGFGRFPVVVVEPEPGEEPMKPEAAERGK